MTSEPIVMSDSDEAARQVTVTGWVSRHGQFYGDNERIARYDGCTHRPCETEGCGKPTEKHWIYCDDCRLKRDIAPNAPSVQLMEMRKAFYAGAASAVKVSTEAVMIEMRSYIEAEDARRKAAAEPPG